MGTYYSPQYVPAYQIQWKNFTDTSTPLSAANLQKSHNAINNIDQAVNSAFNSMDLAKLDKETASSMVTGIDYNENTGTFVIHFFDSSKHPDLTFNTNLEKIIVNFKYNPNTQKLELIQSDGTQVEVDLSDFISNPDLVDSDEIQWTINAAGQISARIKNHSIGAEKLQQNYLSTIIEQAENANESMVNAEYFSKLAKSYAEGGSNLQDRPTENVENAKYYYEETKKVAQGATGQSNAFIGATTDEDGAVGLVPQPKAGEHDKVLQGDGAWGHRLQVDIVEQDGKYGYIQDGAFVPFKSQSDIDAAIRAAMTGTATAEDVLEGKTFTNAEEMGVTGVIPIRQSGQKVVNNRSWTYASRVYFGVNWGYYPKTKTTAGENTSSVFISYNHLRENLGLTEAMLLKGFKVLDITGKGATPTQEKTVTASREQQIVTPDDEDTHLSQVTVEPFPDASGTYTYPEGSTGGTYDMGADNNLRYVNATNVYAKGKADATVPTQEKTITAGTSAVSVTPDEGKHLSKVTVNPTPTESKSVTPTTSQQTVSPSSGKHLSSVTVGAISTQQKTITASTNQQTVTPDSGKYLSKVVVNPFSPSALNNVAQGYGNATVTVVKGKRYLLVHSDDISLIGANSVDSTHYGINMHVNLIQATSNSLVISFSGAADYQVFMLLTIS